MRASDVILALIIILVIILVVLLIHDNYVLREELTTRIGDNTAFTGAVATPDAVTPVIDEPLIIGFNFGNRFMRSLRDPTQAPVQEQVQEQVQEPSGEEYFENHQHNNHADDNQNVHDSHVVKSIREKYNRLLELNHTSELPAHLQNIVTVDSWRHALIETAFTELGNYLATVNLSEADMLKIQAVIDKAHSGHVFESFNTTEDWIITQIWIRINHIDNTDKKDELMSALVDQLKDAGKLTIRFEDALIHEIAAALFGTGNITRAEPLPVVDTECITGRISRYFQTFTLLDADAELAKPIKDKKELENEAFAKSSQILKNMLAHNSDLAELYNSTNDLNPTDTQRLDNFKLTILKSIEEDLTRDYNSIIPSAELEVLITKCKAGI